MPMVIIWLILGSYISTALVEARPYCSWMNQSEYYSPGCQTGEYPHHTGE